MQSGTSLWKAEYLLDIDLIDEQHKKFFDICSRVAQLCDTAHRGQVSMGDIIRAIYELRGYAFKHFHSEESLLVKYRYPDMVRHFGEHDQYLDGLRGLTTKLEGFAAQSGKAASTDFLALAGQINGYALNWWEKHIMQSDQRYAAFIRQKK